MNLFELFVKIGVKDEASKNVSSIASKLGNGLKTAAKVGTAAVGVASAAIVGLTKQATENYAEYEQLVGGVETLFKDSANELMIYAGEAYKNQGISANQYMSLATSFSASLLQSLEGDTEKAVEATNLAITDMSDNANKMGTDMELIQNAYQGFSKANYTMLDNLKLGYGGTKEEMERLVADAAKLDKSIDANSLSFGNVVNAIHAVQTEMGITGTTANEAATTISGSVSTMKAAWADFLTSLADENADYQWQLDNLLESVKTVAKNVFPVVEQVLWSISDMMEDVLPDIVDKIPEVITETLPKILESGANVVKAILEGISKDPDKVVDTILLVIDILIDTIIDLLPELLVVGVMLIGKLAVGLIKARPDLVAKIPELIKAIVEAFKDKGEDLKQIGKDAIEAILDGSKRAWESVKSWFTNAWDKLFSNRSVDVSANVSGGDVDGSHAGGLDYVPFDGYVAELHKGEQVLTAEEARDYKRGGKVVNVVQNIYSTAKTAADLMQEARYQQEKGLIFSV